ncbi:hypothetical protein J2Z37_004971 [Ammoniphilus resinae]|uniref:Uncharacterized protein n=1 Tax=Ammoniphilus resinae TaxID=861532 RepID=A0ABS4GXF8_9BACL|nr:hypothetical protein [Ammoniphilus resinae]
MWYKILFSLFVISGLCIGQGVTTVIAETKKIVAKSCQ